MNLYEKLRRLEEGGAYPLHMPGHKRNKDLFQMENPYSLDITEIEGFDDLHEPEGILAEGMKHAARVFGADESWYLVNGSTAGILAGIAACTQPGDRVLMARNCHKSVYNALILRDLIPVYLYPKAAWGGRVMGSILPEDVEAKLREAAESCGAENVCDRKKISLVVITSPTYEGVVSDVEAIAAVCHSYGVPLMVDEAHGAHLVLAGCTSSGSSQECETGEGELNFPESALRCGADLVVQSLHKTLPAFTQTGLLHRCGDRVSGRRVKHFLDIFQSTSPSYLLMAGIDRCVQMTEDCLERDRREGAVPGGKSCPEGAGACSRTSGRGMDPAAWLRMLGRFYREMRSCRRLRTLRDEPEFWKRDPSKLVISTADTGRTGPDLEKILREEFHFELEMTSADYVIAMTGAGDREEEILRFADSLREIDCRWAEEGCLVQDREQPDPEKETVCPVNPDKERNRAPGYVAVRAETVLAPAEADRILQEGTAVREVTLDEKALGRISLESTYIYPPGIPILAPGERITGEVLEVIERYRRAGIPLRGLSDREKGTIKVTIR